VESEDGPKKGKGPRSSVPGAPGRPSRCPGRGREGPRPAGPRARRDTTSRIAAGCSRSRPPSIAALWCPRLEERDDLHLNAALTTGQRVDLAKSLDEHGPGLTRAAAHQDRPGVGARRCGWRFPRSGCGFRGLGGFASLSSGLVRLPAATNLRSVPAFLGSDRFSGVSFRFWRLYRRSLPPGFGLGRDWDHGPVSHLATLVDNRRLPVAVDQPSRVGHRTTVGQRQRRVGRHVLPRSRGRIAICAITVSTYGAGLPPGCVHRVATVASGRMRIETPRSGSLGNSRD
jgi:hypothetical protein